MSAHPMEPRLSRLEGTHEQLRLGDPEAALDRLQLSLETQLGALGESQARNTRILTGLIVAQWLTIMATIQFRH